MFKKNKSADEYSDKTPLMQETKAEKEERKKQSNELKSSKDTQSCFDWSKKPNKYEAFKNQ